MDAQRSPWVGERHPHFPAMVRYPVFVEGVQRLAQAPRSQRQQVLAELGDNDRSQLVRTLALFDIQSVRGDFDEVALRRLADDQRRPEALRELLQRHYRPALEAIERGATTRELEQLLAVEGRASRSALEKARQFLVWAAREAGFPTAGIRRAPRQPSEHPDQSAPAEEGPPPAGELAGREARFVEQQQRYLDQLLDRHASASGTQVEQLRSLIERASERIDRRLV